MFVDPYTCARCGGLLDDPNGPRICGPCKFSEKQVLAATAPYFPFLPSGPLRRKR